MLCKNVFKECIDYSGIKNILEDEKVKGIFNLLLI